MERSSRASSHLDLNSRRTTCGRSCGEIVDGAVTAYAAEAAKRDFVVVVGAGRVDDRDERGDSV